MTGHSERRLAWAVALGLALLVGILPQFAIGALGPQLRADLQLDTADIGLIFAALYAIGVAGSPIAGPIVDRIGGRLSCLSVLAVAGLALVLASVATSRTGLLLAMVPAGAGMAFANPGTNRWASAASTARGQATLVGVAQAGVQAGALGAGALAAASAIGLDWRWALRLGAVLAVVGIVAAWRGPDDRATASVRDDRSTSSGDGQVAGAGPVDAEMHERVSAVGTGQQTGRTRRALAGYAMAMGAGTAVVFAYLPAFAVDAAAFSLAAAGGTTMVFGGTALLCRLGLGVVLRRAEQVGPRLLVGMAVGSALSIGVIAAGARLPSAIWLGAVLFGATGTTWPAIAFLAVVRSSPPGRSGRVTGWVTAAFYLGLWITPPIAGQVITRIGYAPVWGGAAVCYLVATAPALAATRGTTPRTPTPRN